MKYIWGIYDIYLTPSAILFPRRSYIPPLPGSPKVLRPSLPRSPERPSLPRSPERPPQLPPSRSPNVTSRHITTHVFPPPNLG